jgi:5'-nucleotidase
VISVALRREHTEGGQGMPRIVVEPVSKEPGGRTYNILTHFYMAQGYDGYEALKGCQFLVDDENSRIMSDIIRRFLLGMWPNI